MYYYQSGKELITEPYEHRLQPPSSPATTKNASVLLNNMQKSDSGVYTCEVHNFPDVDGQSEANIMVNVLGKLKHHTKYMIIIKYLRGERKKTDYLLMRCHCNETVTDKTSRKTYLDANIYDIYLLGPERRFNQTKGSKH